MFSLKLIYCLIICSKIQLLVCIEQWLGKWKINYLMASLIILVRNIKKTWGSFLNSDQLWTLIWIKNLKFKFWINSNTYLVREFGGGIQRVAIWIYYKFAFLRTQNCISCSTSKYLFVHFLYYINFCNIKEEEWGREGGGPSPKKIAHL